MRACLSFRGSLYAPWTVLATVGLALAQPAGGGAPPVFRSSLEVVNPSGELNNQVAGVLIADPSVLGWVSNGGRLFPDECDYGNGRWRLQFEDNQRVWQMTGHPVEVGAGYSLRFDAALSGGPIVDRDITAELYIDDDGGDVVVASRAFEFKTPTLGVWDHYHLAVPPGALDAWAGEPLGIRFRSQQDGGPARIQSFDNVRLDRWSAAHPSGDFADDWDTTPNQVWAGPSYWANRLQDWEVDGGRVQCIVGDQERRTLHRAGSSVRADGQDFSLSVRTGVATGSVAPFARAGFLIGAGPNLEWRGAILVHDNFGRDFGLYAGLRSDGSVAIEDYSGATSTTLDSDGGGGLVEGTRLELSAVYQATTGEYALTIDAFDPGDVLLGSASTNVSSDRVLGSFGLLSDHGNGDTTFWFDDFAGSGPALAPEPERHLAIIGAMHTLSRGTLTLTAQLPPLSLTSLEGGPMVAFDTWDGAAWQELALAPVDNTDNLSSYTSTFQFPGWDDSVDTEYRLRLAIDGTEYPYYGTIRRDPVDKDEIVIASTTCQRIANLKSSDAGIDWSPVDIWQPQPLCYGHIAKHEPDVLLALGDQIYEFLPDRPDETNDFTFHHDYLYKWYLWVLQVRDLTCDIPTICIPDDHDVYQGNLWGEGGAPGTTPAMGGYVHPATWVKMVERTQTDNLPDADPYSPAQPPAPVLQGIEVYFTGVVYGRVGFAVLEDRKWKTAAQGAPPNLEDRYLLGDRQKEFLRNWNEDWTGQDVKLVTSQSPFANLRTHGGLGYIFLLNEPDTHGWPVHRRNETWEILRKSRMFQLAGDQHLATLAQHGARGPRDAGFSFTAPAVSNFFPRTWDPVHNETGTTPVISPYLGDFFFDGQGTLPDGRTPNLSAAFPAHVSMRAVGNPLEYHELLSGINPPNLHDRGAGYGIIRVEKSTRLTTFEAWPLHADPEFPQTGSQFSDWPVTIAQTDNDGRNPTGYLPLVDTSPEVDPVVAVFDEADDSLVWAMRIRGSLVRPPVYDNTTSYRVEVSYGDGPVAETYRGLVPAPFGGPQIVSFDADATTIPRGSSTTLRWNVEAPGALTLNPSFGDVSLLTVDGIGSVQVTPLLTTTYTLMLNGAKTESVTISVFNNAPRSSRKTGGARSDFPR